MAGGDQFVALKAMSSISFERAKVNFAIDLYGHRTSGKIRKYVDEISEYDYEKAMGSFAETMLDHGQGSAKSIQGNNFWKTILKGAALIDCTKLPPAKGPADGFTMARKAATKKVMEDVGYRLGAENQRQCRTFWKTLFKMREVGIDKVLFYRTKEFDSYCKGCPKIGRDR
jgi:hypothetical protein